MKEAKHTPGPWLYREDKGGGYEVFPYNGGPPEIGEWAEICTISEYNKDPEADARLIAAAPDLLEALEAVTSSCTSSDVPMSEGQTRIVTAPSRDSLVKARAAIAKAKGRA